MSSVIDQPLATDVIGGFPDADPNCKGCGKQLMLANAWMTDGCPCNSPLGVNSMNETRWRLLMELQQDQTRQLEWLWNNCKVVYHPHGLEYPIEHNPHAKKDGRKFIELAAGGRL